MASSCTSLSQRDKLTYNISHCDMRNVRSMFNHASTTQELPGRVAQSVTCLATDASLTADPGVASLIPYFRGD